MGGWVDEYVWVGTAKKKNQTKEEMSKREAEKLRRNSHIHAWWTSLLTD